MLDHSSKGALQVGDRATLGRHQQLVVITETTGTLWEVKRLTGYRRGTHILCTPESLSCAPTRLKSKKVA